jgi:hypothetical protein
LQISGGRDRLTVGARCLRHSDQDGGAEVVAPED